MRFQAVVVLLTGLLLTAGCTFLSESESRAAEDAVSSDVRMTVSSAKAAYTRQEQIALSIGLTNTGSTDCTVSRVSEGAVTIVSFLRDGVPVAPALTNGSYIDGFAAFLSANLVPLRPGASLSVPWTSEGGTSVEDRRALSTSSLDNLDEAALAFWAVDAPGKYELSARYVHPLPPAAAPAGSPCLASSEAASVAFTVTGG
ncbi:hypothetical protein OG729_06595 [Streptomyces sp. NBC_00210]|uniref:hypothetical protein n=1 Tax=unclassified Streptomyces TaxID=2593676 RepID=UPI00324CCF86